MKLQLTKKTNDLIKFAAVFRSVLFYSCIFTLLSPTVIAQEEGNQSRIGSSILNDTTENIYGPNTVDYFYLSSIKQNTDKKHNIDTTIINQHRFTLVDKSRHAYQDLGNIGTALHPIFYRFPQMIGRTSGFDSYDPYVREADDIQFYNTQSPYSRFRIVLGGEGRALTEAEYNRNIDYRSNVGFNYRGIFADEQIERLRRGDRNVESIYYNLHGNYHTIDNKYWLMGAFIRNSQNIDEYGGILNGTINQADVSYNPYLSFFQDTSRVSLNNSAALDLQRQYYIYHEYRVSKLFEVFHELEHRDQLMRFNSDLDASPESQVLPTRTLDPGEIEQFQDPSTVSNRNKIDIWSNKIGLSGTVDQAFYQIYYQRRSLKYNYRYIDYDTVGIGNQEAENWAGVILRIGDDPEKQMYGQFDYLEGGYYNFVGRVAFKPFYIGLQQMKRKPSITETAYRGTFYEWMLDPEDPVSTQYEGGVRWSDENFVIDAGINYQRLTNYFYFGPTASGGARMFQNIGTVTAFMPRLNSSKWWGDHWLTTFDAVYAQVSGNNTDVYPLPEWTLDAQVSYSDISFDGNLDWQLGVDFHYKSPYKPLAYDPVIQQFHVQNEFTSPSAPIIDVFLNFKINRGRLFLKYTNIFQTFQGYGFMPTPYYPGQVSVLDFGVNWAFYD